MSGANASPRGRSHQEMTRDLFTIERSNSHSTGPRMCSVGIHVALVTLAFIPWTASLPAPLKLNETTVMLHMPSPVVVKPLQLPGRMAGGGGGGKRQPKPASLGVLPRPADRQFVPPDPEPPKNLDPTLIVEPTIVSPQLAELRPLSLLPIGDPNGIPGPPSSGPGTGGGIGDKGDGRGVGDSKGPGTGPGENGGCCGEGVFSVGGGVTPPVVVFRVDPEYSEEARKARYQGTVVLEAIIRKDGKVDILQFVRKLGFGLDQNAIEALKKWRFRPGTMNGKPVDVSLNIEVRFTIH
jgi:protein TonB